MKKEKLKDPRRRKMLLVFPLLVIPFFTMAFWALGGGKAGASSAQKRATGLNLELPNAQLKDDKGENKLSYYREAEKDAAKWKEGIQGDAFFGGPGNDSLPGASLADSPGSLQVGAYKDPTELKVYQKLAELNSRLQNPGNYNATDQNLGEPASPAGRAAVDHAAHLHEPLNTGSSPNAKDPEVEQLNTMMDRILDIQHPERVRQQLSETAAGDQQKTCMVRRNRNAYSVSLLDTTATGEEVNAFYGVDVHKEEDGQNAIDAVVHETQELVDGSIIKIRLLDDIVVDGSAIPKGNFVFGKVSLQGERLHIGINAVRKANALFPVKLIVYDLDGMEGIHIPGAITRDVARQSADNAVQQLETTSIDPSLKVQATTAGINAAKSLLSKKIKLIKVTVKAGYKILLKEEAIQ